MHSYTLQHSACRREFFTQPATYALGLVERFCRRPYQAVLSMTFPTRSGQCAALLTQLLLGLRSILTGVAAAGKGAAYILCLDDDIVLHPGALAALVSGLAAEGGCFMATGKQPITPQTPIRCCI